MAEELVGERPTEGQEEEAREVHLSKVARYLRKQRRGGEMLGADVELCVGEKRLLAHSAVLAAHSQYLLSILEEEEPPLTIRLDDDDVVESALQDCVNFMYDGKVDVCLERLPRLLRAAGALRVEGLLRTLDNYVAGEANNAQLPQLLFLFETVWSKGGRTAVSVGTRQLLLTRVAAEQPLDKAMTARLLGVDAVCKLLADDRLRTTAANGEMDVFETALLWIEQRASSSSPLQCHQWAGRLFDCVRFGLLSSREKLRCTDMLATRLPDALHKLLRPLLNGHLSQADWLRSCVEAKRTPLSALPPTRTRRDVPSPADEQRGLYAPPQSDVLDLFCPTAQLQDDDDNNKNAKDEGEESSSSETGASDDYGWGDDRRTPVLFGFGYESPTSFSSLKCTCTDTTSSTSTARLASKCSQ